MAPVEKCPEKAVNIRPRILVVDDELSLVETVQDIVGPRLACDIMVAENLKQARKIIASQPIELLVTDVTLPDGDGLTLLPDLKKQQPSARAIVITGQPSVANTLSAFRSGALDLIPKPFSSDQIIDGVRKALDRQSMVLRHEKRLLRLKSAVKKLSEARKLVSKKVDLLCNDLVSAYGELARQLDSVRTEDGFRKYIEEAKDLEQLLCHTMDWLLRELGYCNIALWLASSETDHFQLGAYMKYTVAGEETVTEAMKREILPTALRDGLVRYSPDEMAERFSDEELEHLGGQEFLGINCTYLGEALAAVVFFRDSAESFSEEDAEMLRMISPIFAVALASIVREHQGTSDDGGVADDENDAQGRMDADWWKRGESPPF